MIQLQHVSKCFQRQPALCDLSLEVRRGEIFGLLGHNGAGKSTAFGVLLGQVHPSAGEAFIGGVSVQRDRAQALARAGAIFETPGFYEYLSGWRNLEIFASYSGRVSRQEMIEAVETVGLTGRIHDAVRTYSHGMRQRLALGQALVPAPEVVLLDEPTEGLDPEGIHEMRELIKKLNRERGLTVLLSSHLLSEVEQLCDRVAILNQGQKIFEGRWGELAGSGQRFRIDVDDWPKALGVAQRVGAKVLEDQVFEIAAGADVADLITTLVGEGVKVRAVEPLRASLEQLYLQMMQPRDGASHS